MQAHYKEGNAAYALVTNTIIQAQARIAYHVSGGACGPGTDTTQITTKVQEGRVNIDGEPVDFAGGEPPHPPADAKPRVDVVSVTRFGDFDVTPGTPDDFAPTHDEDGNPIQSHTPFHHWTPAADDGRNVQGVPLCLVLIRPDTQDATGLTDADVNDEIVRIPGPDQSQYVRGDGVDNGPTAISVNDADFAVQDQTDAKSKYLWRDHSEGVLNIGSPNAVPTLRARLDANDNPIEGVEGLTFSNDNEQLIDFFSTTSDGSAGVFTVRDASKGYEDVFSADADKLHHHRPTDFHDTVVSNIERFDLNGTRAGAGGEPIIDLSESSTGSHVLWEVSDGTPAPTRYYAHANPANGTLLSLNNRTDSEIPFRVQTDGDTQIDGSLAVAGEVRCAHVQVAQGEPPNPPNEQVVIYNEGASDNLIAKDSHGEKIVLGNFSGS